MGQIPVQVQDRPALSCCYFIDTFIGNSYHPIIPRPSPYINTSYLDSTSLREEISKILIEDTDSKLRSQHELNENRFVYHGQSIVQIETTSPIHRLKDPIVNNDIKEGDDTIAAAIAMNRSSPRGMIMSRFLVDTTCALNVFGKLSSNLDVNANWYARLVVQEYHHSRNNN